MSTILNLRKYLNIKRSIHYRIIGIDHYRNQPLSVHNSPSVHADDIAHVPLLNTCDQLLFARQTSVSTKLFKEAFADDVCEWRRTFSAPHNDDARALSSTTPTKRVGFSVQPEQIASSLTHTLVLRAPTQDNDKFRLYAASNWRDEHIDYCTFTDARGDPTHVDSVDGLLLIETFDCVRAIACGAHFSVVLTDSHLHAFGRNDVGQLGTASQAHDYERFEYDFSSQSKGAFVRLRSGWGHTIAFTDTELYAFGANRHGQCGLPASTSSPLQRVELPSDLTRILDIQCGATHNLLLGERADGSTCVLVWGSAGDSKLGFNSKEDIDVPTEHPFFSSKRATQIATSTDSSYVLVQADENDTCAQVYGFGFFQHAPEAQTLHEPTLLPTLRDALHIRGGTDQTLIVWR